MDGKLTRSPGILRRLCAAIGGSLLALPALAAAPIAVRSKIPLLWHVRDYPRTLETTLLAHLGAQPIAISPSVAGRLAAILKRPALLIENGIDTARFALRAPQLCNPGAVKLIAVAHLASWKGHEVLLDAFADARSRRCAALADRTRAIASTGERLPSEPRKTGMSSNLAML